MPRYSASRQKACHACSTAKSKCDRRAPCCSRCVQRGLKCAYPAAPKSNASSTTKKVQEAPFSLLTPPDITAPEEEGSVDSISDYRDDTYWTEKNSISNDDNQSSLLSTHNLQTPQSISNPKSQSSEKCLDASALVCPIDANEISCRWLNAYVPLPGQQIKNYPVKVTSFIFRVLKSYTAACIRGNTLPPFIHSSQHPQFAPESPLSTCLSLVRMWQMPNPVNNQAANNVLSQEMQRLYNEQSNFGTENMLFVYQAYLIYTMVLFFHDNPGTTFLRQAMTNLQDIACSTSRQGLVCRAVFDNQRPPWLAWIHTEAKRRTLYTTYLFDSLLSAQEGLNSYLGTELRGLSAPSNQALWQVESDHEYKKIYSMHLVDWEDRYLSIDELWPVPAGMTESDIAKRRIRVDRWLEDVDAFGMMLYTVTSQTHGG